jgi:hypothetical protein
VFGLAEWVFGLAEWAFGYLAVAIIIQLNKELLCKLICFGE